MFPDSRYEKGAVQLDPGDLVITCTDGVIGAVDPRYGMRSWLSLFRLQNLLTRPGLSLRRWLA
jgi:serine phosphatase RsbU (regulator of sigma subunit)